jgi:predicted ATPase
MVGRKKELDRILELFEHTVAGGKVFLTVGGLSGIGKSTLICETAKPLTQCKGIILSGKFDQLQKNIPYYAWIQAFEQFADTILSEPPHILAQWRVKFKSSLQGVDSVLIQMAPKLGKVLGLHDKTPTLSAVELKNRLQYGVGLFLSLLAAPYHPLILFLDDWQWADEDSIRLLESIISNPSLNNLMVVAAYRTNEVSSIHPFYPIIKDCIDNPGQSVHEPIFRESISLLPLSEKDNLTLLQNTLNKPQQKLELLSKIIYSKTQGNPFLAGELLALLFTKKLLWIDSLTHH